MAPRTRNRGRPSVRYREPAIDSGSDVDEDAYEPEADKDADENDEHDGNAEDDDDEDEDDESSFASEDSEEDGRKRRKGGSTRRKPHQYTKHRRRVSSDNEDGSSRKNKNNKTRSSRRKGREADSGEDNDEEDDEGDDDDVHAARRRETPPPDDIYEVPPYPQNQVSTRTYGGPLRKWDRYRTLVELLYGPDTESLKVIHRLRQIWIDCVVLPEKAYLVPSLENEGNANEDDGSGGDDNDNDNDNDNNNNNNNNKQQGSPWLASGTERNQERLFRTWFARLLQSSGRQVSHAVAAGVGQRFLPHLTGDLVVLLGPAADQQPVRLEAGRWLALDQATGRPNEEEEAKSTAADCYMINAGGLVLSMAWAPQIGTDSQLLALAVVPHSDQAPLTPFDQEEQQQQQQQQTPEEDRSKGSIQFWKMHLAANPEGEKTNELEASKVLQLERVIGFQWGRPKQIQWCPVPLTGEGESESDTSAATSPSSSSAQRNKSVYGLLAVLADDCLVRAVQVRRAPATAKTTQYELIEQPLATLGSLPDEYNIGVTCLTWTGLNRLALGHSDGSITLWAVDSRLPDGNNNDVNGGGVLLLRIPVHETRVLDISSGYPSHPYMVASLPVGGVGRLVDLSTRPSAEHTFHASPAIRFQPGLLRWSEVLQGFVAPAATSATSRLHTSTLEFCHVRFFATPRTFLLSNPGLNGPVAPPTCQDVVGSGGHPFALVGRTDGSLWVVNVMRKVLGRRDDQTFRIKVLDSTFRPVEELGNVQGEEEGQNGQNGQNPILGVVRILQGFAPEINDVSKKPVVDNKKPARNGTKGRSRANNGNEEDNDEDEDDDEDDDDDDDDQDRDTGHLVVHDPLTRITAVAWNPNRGFDTWGAAALGSGLVRILDVGV